MRLQTFCIDEQAAECYKPDIPEGVVAEHKVTDTNQHGGGCSNVRCLIYLREWLLNTRSLIPINMEVDAVM
jgi:hypothetical protein